MKDRRPNVEPRRSDGDTRRNGGDTRPSDADAPRPNADVRRDDADESRPDVDVRRTDALVDRLRGYDTVVEVGIGNRPDVTAALAEAGVRVTATDVHRRSVPGGVTFVRDDVTDPDPEVYEHADAVYGLNLPPELHRPARSVATSAGAAFLFTTLGGDQPAVPVERETLPGETLYRATQR